MRLRDDRESWERQGEDSDEAQLPKTGHPDCNSRFNSHLDWGKLSMCGSRIITAYSLLTIANSAQHWDCNPTF